MAQPADQPSVADDTELDALLTVLNAAQREHEVATAVCAVFEGRMSADLSADPVATERLLCAQDRVIAARDRYLAAEDRYEAAKDRRRAAAYLRESYRDELTGVLQRQAGQTELEHEVDRAKRNRAPLVIVFVDVDGLKQINDEQGHLAGDAVLRAAGTALRNGLRSYDVIMRFGGDEFVCGLPGASGDEVGPRMGDVQARLGELCQGASMSFGYAELRAEDTLRDVMQRADADLYARRARGRGQSRSTVATAPEVIDISDARKVSNPQD